MTTLSRETSKQVFDLVGWYETKKISMWSKRVAEAKCSGRAHPKEDHHKYAFVLADRTELKDKQHNGHGTLQDYLALNRVWPTPSFAELIRVFPKIGENKGWKKQTQIGNVQDHHAVMLLSLYMDASTEEEGMKSVEDYLLKIL